MAPLNHADDVRVITTGILSGYREKVTKTSSGEVSPLNPSRFHTVCLIYAASVTVAQKNHVSVRVSVRECSRSWWAGRDFDPNQTVMSGRL